ncbi:MAG: hypothetical protein NTX49_05800 [Chlamydiae bacterium]|nr:hypothetical protein [Chlamydiota bacterium]
MSTSGPTGPAPIHSYYRIDPSRDSQGTPIGSLGSHVVTVRTTDPSISPSMIRKALETASTQFTDEIYLREVTVQKGTDDNSLTVAFTKFIGPPETVTCPITGPAATNHPIVRDLANFHSPNPVNFESPVGRVPTYTTRDKSSWAQFSKSVITFIRYALRTIYPHLPGFGHPFLSEEPILTISSSTENTPPKPNRTSLASFIEGLRAMNMVTKELEVRSSTPTALDGIIKLGEGIQEVHAGKKTPTVFMRELSPKLKSATKESPVVLPTGSFSEGKFVPAILIIYKNEGSETYTVKGISLAQDGSSGRGQGVDSYTFSTDGMLKFFISGALENSNPTNKHQRSLDQILDTYVTSKVCTKNPQSQEDLIPSGTSTNPDLLGLLSACGNRVNQLEEHISSLQQKLSLHEIASAVIPGDPVAIKKEIRAAQNELLELTEGSLASLANTGSLHPYLTQITQLILTKIRNLPSNERAAYVVSIKKNAKALKQQLTLAYGEPIANAFMTALLENIKRLEPSTSAPLTPPVGEDSAQTGNPSIVDTEVPETDSRTISNEDTPSPFQILLSKQQLLRH